MVRSGTVAHERPDHRRGQLVDVLARLDHVQRGQTVAGDQLPGVHRLDGAEVDRAHQGHDRVRHLHRSMEESALRDDGIELGWSHDPGVSTAPARWKGLSGFLTARPEVLTGP